MTYKYKILIDDDLYKWRSLWGTGMERGGPDGTGGNEYSLNKPSIIYKCVNLLQR